MGMRRASFNASTRISGMPLVKSKGFAITAVFISAALKSELRCIGISVYSCKPGAYKSSG